VSEQAVKACAARVVKPDGEPAHVYLLDVGDGKPQRFEATPEPREHEAWDIDAIVDFANDFSAIWYARNGIRVLIDDNLRRDCVMMPLKLSHQVDLITGWEKSASSRMMSQKDLIKLLRVDFADCLGQAGEFLAVIRKLKFETATKTAGEIKHGRASLGKEIETAVSGDVDIPEEVIFDVPVFDGAFPALRARVRCAIDLDAATEKITLMPIPGHLEAGIREAEARIGRLIGEKLAKGNKKTPTFYGVP
jgi:hypothetical protein